MVQIREISSWPTFVLFPEDSHQWIAGLEDEQEIPLAIVVSIDEDEEVPEDECGYFLDIKVLPTLDHFNDGVLDRVRSCCGIEPDEETDGCGLLVAAAQYGLGVPAGWFFHATTCPGEPEVYHEYDEEYGIFRFREEDEAREWIEKVLKNRAGILSMCGFLFDRQVNALGNTGWDLLGEMVTGKSAIKSFFERREAEREE